MPPDDERTGPALRGEAGPGVQASGENEFDFIAENERAAVGALLQSDDRTRAEMLALLDDQDFTDMRCRFVADVIRRMDAAGEPVDVLTVAGFVDRHGLMASAPRMALRSELHDLAAAAPVAASGTWYAAAVLEAAARRRTLLAATTLTAGAIDGSLQQLRIVVADEMTAAAESLDRALAGAQG